MITSPLSSSAIPRCGICGAAGSCSLDISSPRLVLPLPSLSQVDGEFMSPPCPLPSSPGTPLPVRVTPDVSDPLGNSSTPGVLVPLVDSNPTLTPWRSPLGFSATPEALAAPSLSPTPEDFPDRFPAWRQHSPFPLV